MSEIVSYKCCDTTCDKCPTAGKESVSDMNALIANNCISEMMCGSNFSYILNDNSSFLSTEYKVLQSQANSCFVKCMKMLYNGKVQLYYLTNKYKALSMLLPTLDADNFMVICANLFSDIIDVKNNGFLSCQNIDISFDRIYVDTTTYKVSLIYLPVSQRMYDDASSFENELRTGIIKLIQGISTLSTPKTLQFSSNLSNGTLSIENIFTSIKSGKTPIAAPQNAPISDVLENRGQMKLVAMNAPTHIEIAVTKNNFTIGKKAELVDGVVGFNKMISRSHCKITKNGSQFFITDLQSANGTYVNHTRLQPNQPHPIKGGDLVRLANSDFQVIVE